VTIESNTVIVVSKGFGVLFFDFLEESGKKWEDCIQKAIAGYYGPDEIVEFYPKLLLAGDQRVSPRRPMGHKQFKVPGHQWYKKDPRVFYAIIRKIAKPIIRTAFSVKVEGLEHVPAKGPAIILSNHSSFLDAIMLGVFPKRYIWYMTKSSQYENNFLRWFLKLAKSFPVRRYTTDVLAVRNAIRVVQQGHILGIFPEGERSWDGRMLPFKQGAMRLVLALGQPVIPVGISGAYGLMPRWTHKIKRVPVTIRFGRPIRLDHIPIPRQTKDHIKQTSVELKKEILQLIGDQNHTPAARQAMS
jgi:1-acyl-sn-glycerol-3-phosphate acyltransferase